MHKIDICGLVWWLSLSSLPSERDRIVSCRHDYADDPTAGIRCTLWVFKLINWQELMAKEALSLRLCGIHPGNGLPNFSFCALQWTTPLRKPQKFLFLQKNLPCTQLPMLVLFSFSFSIIKRRKKEQFQRTENQCKWSGSMMQPRPARHWTLQLVSSWASKAARVSDKLGIPWISYVGQWWYRQGWEASVRDRSLKVHQKGLDS